MLVDPAIATLASTPLVMREMLAPLPEELRSAPDEEGWSARDVVAHLVLRQRPAIIGRVTAILENPGGAIPDVPGQLMDPASLRSKPFEELLAAFAEGRAEAVELLRKVTSEQLLWRGVHSGVGEISIADIIHHVAYHDLVHVAQAAKLAQAAFEPLRGGMRRFH